MDLKKDRDYKNIIEALRPTLHCRSFKVIAIDGWPCVGKTTLGRFLANYFDISLIETDLFLEPHQDKFVYKYCMIKYAISLDEIVADPYSSKVQPPLEPSQE